MDAHVPGVADLQAQWKAQDGAAIANSLRQILDLPQQEMEAGVRALAAHFGMNGKPTSQPGSSSSSGHPSSGSACSEEVVATAERKRPRQDAEPVLENDIWLKDHGEPEFSNQSPTLLVFNDTNRMRGLACPTRSADFARLLREPRFVKLKVLRMDDYTGTRLKPNAEACQAIADLTELQRVAMPHISPRGGAEALLAKGLWRVQEAWLYCDGTLLGDVSRHMTHLVRLRIDLREWIRLSAEAVRNYAVFSCLRHLFLRGGGELMATSNRAWSNYTGSGGLKDEALRLLLSKMPALVALDISFNLYLSEASLVTLSAHPTLRTLRWHHLPQSVLSSNLWPRQFSQAPALQRLDVSFLSPSPQDGSGKIQDVKGLSDALPNINVVAEPKESSNLLAEWVPAGWPIEECMW
eukprot:TRINITY_DN23656_c2_g1_i2.p1 TRINITY_DN23656_c2_g1~~TRINITY_DN23656_c2_g1_i2.p1  ORF type:complete len:409 (-),score=63.81 TRINITY_DN23656_c2_g1_i2:129-1355(-)